MVQETIVNDAKLRVERKVAQNPAERANIRNRAAGGRSARSRLRRDAAQFHSRRPQQVRLGRLRNGNVSSSTVGRHQRQPRQRHHFRVRTRASQRPKLRNGAGFGCGALHRLLPSGGAAASWESASAIASGVWGGDGWCGETGSWWTRIWRMCPLLESLGEWESSTRRGHPCGYITPVCGSTPALAWGWWGRARRVRSVPERVTTMTA